MGSGESVLVTCGVLLGGGVVVLLSLLLFVVSAAVGPGSREGDRDSVLQLLSMGWREEKNEKLLMADAVLLLRDWGLKRGAARKSLLSCCCCGCGGSPGGIWLS